MIAFVTITLSVLMETLHSIIVDSYLYLLPPAISRGVCSLKEEQAGAVNLLQAQSVFCLMSCCLIGKELVASVLLVLHLSSLQLKRITLTDGQEIYCMWLSRDLDVERARTADLSMSMSRPIPDPYRHSLVHSHLILFPL